MLVESGQFFAGLERFLDFPAPSGYTYIAGKGRWLWAVTELVGQFPGLVVATDQQVITVRLEAIAKT